MKKYLVLALTIIISIIADGQNADTQKPCSAPEASQFDFWIGDWDLTWNDTSHGTNSIHKIMGGCTVSENFYDPSMNYSGNSWSVFNPRLGIWQQTWVDNQGGYIALKGKFENGEMTLTTDTRKAPDGKDVIFRMVFYNIASNKFDWRWESTKDNGSTWKTNWLIHYKRKSS